MFPCSERHGKTVITVAEQRRRALTPFERQQIYDKFGGCCAYCGCEITIKEMQADHMIPLHLGGADEISNLYPACRACNHYKSTYTVEKFRAVIQQAPAVLMKSSATYRNLVRFGLIKHPEKTVVRFYFERELARMTSEEAIAIIRRKTSIPDSGEAFEDIEKAYDMAIEALEKQISKKPIQNRNEGIRYTSTYSCPSCGGRFAGTMVADYCYHCGQALRWDVPGVFRREFH